MTFHGECLCGAVKVSAEASDPAMRACHCEMCRKHTSSMFMSLKFDQDTIKIEGPVKTYESSDWAVRGFCDACGSTIFYGERNGPGRNLAAGLFENAIGAPMVLEFFEDNCPNAYHLESTGQQKLSREETIALFTGDDA